MSVGSSARSRVDPPGNYRVRLGYSDAMRADKALERIRGNRLTYRRPHTA
jgi:hypothetical protein